MNKCETETFTHGFTSCLQLLLTMMMIYHPSYLITYQLVKNWTDLLWLVCIQDQSLTLTGCGVEFCLSHSPAPFNIMHSKTHLLAYIACRTSVKQWQVSERMLIYIPVKETVGSVKMVLAESFKLTGLMSLAEHTIIIIVIIIVARHTIVSLSKPGKIIFLLFQGQTVHCRRRSQCTIDWR